eukprot:scaffold95368_cov28-Tisochrysis_lutea.AAC.1
MASEGKVEPSREKNDHANKCASLEHRSRGLRGECHGKTSPLHTESQRWSFQPSWDRLVVRPQARPRSDCLQPPRN